MPIYKKVDITCTDTDISVIYLMKDCYGGCVELYTENSKVYLGIDELKRLVSELEAWDAQA